MYANRFGEAANRHFLPLVPEGHDMSEEHPCGQHWITVVVNSEAIATYGDEAEVKALILGLHTADPALKISTRWGRKARGWDKV